MSTPAHSDLPKLWDFPIEQHLLNLGTSEELPSFSIGLCTARYEEIAPTLLGLLERAAEGGTFDDDERRLFFRGLHIIGGRRDPRGFQPLLRLLRRPAPEVDHLLGAATSGTLEQIVAGVFDGDVAALLEAIADPNIEEIARDSLLTAATFLTWEGLIPRQQFVEFLTRFHAEPLASEGDAAWFAWAHAITLLGLRDLWPTFLAAVEAGLLPLDDGEVTFFEDELAAAEQAPEDIQPFQEASIGYIDDVVDALERFYNDGDDLEPELDEDAPPLIVPRRTWPATPATNPFRDVGRNDPCPCGSGKKAKRCCLAA